MADWYDYDPETTELTGGGYIDQPSYPPGTGAISSSSGGYQTMGGRANAPLLNSWESEDWKPNFGLSDIPGYGGGQGGPRPTGLGPRQLAPTSPSIAPPNLGSPERTLYDRYSKLLQDPNALFSDPAYTALFNQGMQAFNRTAAANRLRFSGKSMDDSMKYGQGLATQYFNTMMPQFKSGADEELSRWMGPSQIANQRYGLDQSNVRLAQSGTQLNNATRGEAESNQAAGDLIPQMSQSYQQLMGLGGYGGMSGGSGGGSNSNYDTPSYGGINSGYGYPNRLGAGGY